MSKAGTGQRLAGVQMSGQMISRSPSTHADGLSVRDFLFFVWRSRWLALIVGAAFGAAAAAAAWIVTPQYTATVVLLPVTSHGSSLSSGALGAAVSQFSSLASLAGLNLGGEEAQKAEALATLQSQVLTDQYVQRHDLLPILFAREWNPAARAWRTSDRKDIPTIWKANQLFAKKIRTVDDNPRTGLVKLTIKWKDPRLAAEWANGLVKLTNNYLRQKSIDEAERSIAYLNNEVTKTNVVEVKNAIYGLMEAEINKEMVAKGRRDFALRVIDPAVPPERKSFPRPLLWVVASVIAGIFLGLLANVLRETITDERSGTMTQVSDTTHLGDNDTRLSSAQADHP